MATSELGPTVGFPDFGVNHFPLRLCYHKARLALVRGTCSTDVVALSPESNPWSSAMLMYFFRRIHRLH